MRPTDTTINDIKLKNNFTLIPHFIFLHFIVMIQKNVFFIRKKNINSIYITLFDRFCMQLCQQCQDNYMFETRFIFYFISQFLNFSQYKNEHQTKNKSVLSIFGMTCSESTINVSWCFRE